MGERRWNAIARELRKLVLGGCCAIGGLGGLWSGIWTTAPPEGRGAALADLARMLEPLVARFGIGLAAGAAAGLAVCLTILKPRRG
jgi:hypothetical protein